jgi:Protein of unknown function (DUF3108)
MSTRKYLSLFLFGIVFLTLTSSPRLLADFTEVTRPDPALIQTAFPRNEKIIYELTWLGIKAGTVSISIRQKESGNWCILGEARSSPLFSFFFPVEDRFETEIGPEMFPEWITLQQREGCYKAFRRVTFQQDRLKVISEKDNDPSKTYKLNRPSHNELTSFLVLRTLPLKAGQSVFVETFASDKSYTVEVKVIKRERLQTNFGEVNAIKVRPELPFKTVQEQQGEFYAWFTDDQRRLPIKLEGGVVLGSIVGKLVEWQVDDRPLVWNPGS